MKFDAHQTVAAPPQTVLDEVPAGFERLAAGYGADVIRIDDGTAGPAGAAWRVDFAYRGHRKSVEIRTARYDPAAQLCMEGESDGLRVTAAAVVEGPGTGPTALSLGFQLAARTLTARLLMQPLKLAHGSLSRRLDAHLAEFARRVEARVGRASAE